MEIVKKIGLRILLLAVIAIATSAIYKRYFYQSFLEKEGFLLYRLNRSVNADYLFFSASSDYTFDSINDIDTSRVSVLTMNYCTKSVKSIAGGAHHAGVFKQLIKHIPKNTIEGIIVSFNIRSFSPKWLTGINENLLQKYTALYKPNPVLISRLTGSLKFYPIRTQKELEQERNAYFSSWPLPYLFPKNTVKNWYSNERRFSTNDSIANISLEYLKSFAFVINDNHSRTKDFDEIVELAKSKNLKLILHVLPENMDEARRLIGDSLTALIQANRDFAIARYHNPTANVWVIDNLEKVRHVDFTDRDFPTEHYNQNGRTIIAKSIAKQLNAIK